MIPFIPEANHLPRFQPEDRPPGIGDWVLTELLGMGGFGEVWKAHNPHFTSIPPVALKFCTDVQAREVLLKHEAKVLDRVMRHGHHPGIVRLQHTFLSSDPPCLEYEYVAGGDLAGLIIGWHRQTQRPSPTEIAEFFLQIVDIVAFAHRLDPAIVHRDLKPANILVQRSGEEVWPRITDFGIGGIATSKAIHATRQMTNPGQFLATAFRGSGTWLYASPEQLRGNQPDPRDDVHALGVIWYQMLRGDLSESRPSGPTWRLRFRQQGLPEEMVTLLESCFDEQDHRPSDASALADKLRLIVDQTKVNPEPGETFAPIRTAPALPTPTTVVKTDAPRTISQEPSSDDLTTSDHQQPILDSQIITSIGLKMNLLPAGDFMMGSRRDDTEAHSGEKPPKNVRIDHEFYLGVTPVTNAHYSRMMPQAPPHDHNERDRPVVNVTWFDAIDFCNALSRAEGVPPYYESHDGHITIPDLAAIGYRLPTEAEWEYACRAGTTTRFSFGDRPQTRTFDRFAWYIENSDKYLHNVGQKESNRFGLFDMHGNVWEWCWDAPGSQLSKKSTLNATRATAEKPFSAGTGTIISPLLSKEHATRELTIYSHMNPDAQKKILSKAKKDPGYAASLLKEIDSFKKRSSGGRLKAFKNLKTLILSIHGSPPNSIQSENARPLLTSHSREHLKDQKKGSDRIVGPKVLSDEPTKRGRGAPRLSELRVFRGGAFDSFRAALRSANKSYSWPKHHDLDLGFRIARNAPSNPAL